MSNVTERSFGVLPDGRPVAELIITDAAGNEAGLINYGAAIRSLRVKNRAGQAVDVCLGYDSAREYAEANSCFGGTMGRCTGRTAGAAVTLSGVKYALSQNRNGFHMHGGFEGFNKKLWDYEAVGNGVRFSYLSPDGEEGYPGRLCASVLCAWARNGVLRVEYDCVSDKETTVNLTNHSYFNLNGHDSGSALGHTLRIPSARVAETDADSVATGNFIDVRGTPLDFLSPHAIGERIDADFGPLRATGGYDQNYTLPGSGMSEAAVLRGDKSGIEMSVYTELPDLGLYTANFLAEQRGKNGAKYGPRQAVCLETQFLPNAVNLSGDVRRPVFMAGEHYKFATEFRFGTADSD